MSVPKSNLNFSNDFGVPSKQENNLNKEVPVLKTKIIKSNSNVLTNIIVNEKRSCRLCKTVTEPLKNQEYFTISMTTENQYIPEPKTKYATKDETYFETDITKKSNVSLHIISTVPPVRILEPRTQIPTKYAMKDETYFETDITKKSNVSLYIISTVPPVRILEPRTQIPFIQHMTISLPKSVKTSVLFDASTKNMENSIPLIITESSKPLSFPEPRTISAHELEIKENSSNESDLVRLDSSFRSSSDIPISHQETAYLNLY
ncbi:unnamed protein product [Meganyctiphanes norvegica]|uniref:Uncharacterized protein n=1 Tax=Meganyctiphanes norvegica TaxID=48144 RepID=A0AAV2Q3S5_MEGNR